MKDGASLDNRSEANWGGRGGATAFLPMSPASDLLFSAASRGRAGIKSEIFGRPEW